LDAGAGAGRHVLPGVALVVHLRGAGAGGAGTRLAIVLAGLGHAVAALGLAHLVALVLAHVVGVGKAGNEGAERQRGEGPGGGAHGVLLVRYRWDGNGNRRMARSSPDSRREPIGLQSSGADVKTSTPCHRPARPSEPRGKSLATNADARHRTGVARAVPAGPGGRRGRLPALPAAAGGAPARLARPPALRLARRRGGPGAGMPARDPQQAAH